MQPPVARYPRPLRHIHWIVALLVMAQLAVAVVLTQLRSLAYGQAVLELHREMGLVILILLLVRLAIGRKFRVPKQPALGMPAWQSGVATTVHRLFYVLLILQPVIGIAVSWARGDAVKLIGLIAVSAPFEISDAARDNLMQAHIVNAVLLLCLTMLHIGAIVFNRVVRGVSVIERMLPAAPAERLINRTPIAIQMSVAFGLLITIAMLTGMYAISKYRDFTQMTAVFQAGEVAAANATRTAQVAWKELLGPAGAVPDRIADQPMRDLADTARSSVEDAASHSKPGDVRNALTALVGNITAATPAGAAWRLAELRSIDTQLQDVVDSESADVFQGRTENDEEAARGHDLIVVALLPTAIVGIFVALLLARSISGSLNRMSMFVRAVASGQSDGAMEVIGRGEFSALMRDMLTMRMAVEQRGDEAAAQRRAFESDRVRLAEESQEREAAAERQATAERQQAEAERLNQLERERHLLAAEFETQVAGIVESVTHTVRDLKVTADKMAVSASNSAQCSRDASKVARQTSETASLIATGAAQLSTAAKTVRGHAGESKSQAKRAVEEAAEAKAQIDSLVEATRQISNIAEVIIDIARHTNLLAVNARVQAALAGEAGRGFAIVATEVKDLAAKTRSAIDGIAGQIDQVSNGASRSVEFLQRVSARIESLEGAATGIFNSADTQCASTSDIADRVAEISVSTRSVAKNIDEAQSTASATKDMSTLVLEAADLMEERALQLEEQVTRFVLQIQEGSGGAAAHAGSVSARRPLAAAAHEPPMPQAMAG